MSAMAHAIEETPTVSLQDLRGLSFNELEKMYRAARRPASIADLDGDAIGAMLAWRSPRRGPIAWLLRTFGASSTFPWEGKTFKSESNERGTGINRVRFFGQRRWFPFKTRFEPSFLDARPAFRLDYSGPANPPLIRSIVDEVREVAPGLYLGPAAFLWRGKPRPILFFAVSLNEADRRS